MEYVINGKNFELLEVVFVDTERETSRLQQLENIIPPLIGSEINIDNGILSLLLKEIKSIKVNLDDTSSILGDVMDESQAKESA